MKFSIFALVLSLVLLAAGGQPALGSGVKVTTDKLIQLLINTEWVYGSMLAGLVSRSHGADRNKRIAKLLELRGLVDKTDNEELREFFLESWRETVMFDVSLDVADVLSLYIGVWHIIPEGEFKEAGEQAKQLLADRAHVLLLERLLQGDISKEAYQQEYAAIWESVGEVRDVSEELLALAL